MADIVSQRSTFLVVSDSDGLYPVGDLYPSPDLYPEKSGTITISNIVSGSLKLDELIAEKVPQFGQLFATKFECTVYLCDDIQNKFIQVYQEDGNEYRVIFTGFIDSCKLDNSGTDRKIVAYDFGYEKGKLNIAEWWEQFWLNRESSTLKTCRDSMLSWAGISFENVVLPNDDLEIEKTVSLTSCTLSAMLRMMCELNYCFPHFNSYGELEFIMLNLDPEETVDLTGLYEGSKSKFEDFETAEITGVQFYDSGNELKYTYGTTENAYPIRQNIFLYNQSTEILDDIGEQFMEYLSEFVYTPASVKMIVSNLEFKLGDFAHTEKGDFYILRNSLSGVQLYEQTLKAEGQSVLYGGTPNFDYDEVILNEKIARVKQTVESFSIDYADFKRDTASSFRQTADDIASEVRRATSAEGTLASDLASEVSRATQAEGTISGDLVAEIGRATQAESTLSSNISQTAQDISTEVIRATRVEGEISGAISDEVSRATGAESTIAGNLADEVSRATSAESTLSSNITQTAQDITSEVTRATEVEESMFANYLGTVTPTTSNVPASGWSTDTDKQAHVGETYYDKTAKRYYRWTATTSQGTTTYSWEQIDLTNKRTYEVVSSGIKQTAESISLEVTNGSDSSTIKLNLGNTELSSKTIQMTGLVKFTDLSTSGSTIINGSNITTGVINADLITTGNLSADRIKGGQLTIDPDTGWATAIVVRKNNRDYITMTADDGIEVKNLGGSVTAQLSSSGLSIGYGSVHDQVEIEGSTSSGKITVGSTTSNQTIIENGTVSIAGGSSTNPALKVTGSASITTTSGNALTLSAGSSYNALSVSAGKTALKQTTIDGSSVTGSAALAVTGSSSGTALSVTQGSTSLKSTTIAATSSLYAALTIDTGYADIDNYRGAFYASSSSIGFFGSSTGTSKKTVNKLSSTATLANVITKVNDLLTALKDYNLISST